MIATVLFFLAGLTICLATFGVNAGVNNRGRHQLSNSSASVGPRQTLRSFSAALHVNSENWQAVATAISDNQRRLIFTTFKGVNPEMKKMNANFYYWAHLANLSSNVLLMSEDLDSCAMLWDVGVPCWVDDYCPRGDQLPEGQYQIAKNHWYCKYWWAREFTQNGFTALFMDNDNIILRDPFKFSDAGHYDFEALSDWVRNDHRPTPQEVLMSPCGGYKEILFEGQGQQLMNQDYDKENKIALAATPCVSAGLWFAHPKQTTVKFFDDLLVWLVAKNNPSQWDQAAFNEVLTAHLLNVRDSQDTLTFRLLSHQTFPNLPIYIQLLRTGINLEEAVMHPCCVGQAKQKSLSEVGLWQAEEWRPQLGYNIVRQFMNCFKSQNCEQIATAKLSLYNASIQSNKNWRNELLRIPD